MSHVIVDFSILYYRMLFASKRSVIEDLNYFAHLLMNGILINFQDFELNKDNRLIIAVDCHKRDLWRTKYYLDESEDFSEYNKPVRLTYKGNRVKDNEMPWEKIFEIIEDFLNTLTNCSDVQVIKHPNAEADDVISVTSHLYGIDPGLIIVSNDQDFHQLVKNNVKLYNPISKKEIKVEESTTLLLTQILTGQGKKDNILPVRKGLGPKTALKEIPNLKAKLKIDPDFKARFNFNKKLIDLDLIPPYIEEDIKSQLETSQFNFNLTGLLDFCKKYKLRKHMDNMVKLKLKDNNSSTKLW